MERQFITFDVDAPADRVVEVMKDIDRWPEWTPTVKRVTRFDAGEFRVGSRVMISQPKFPPAVWKATRIEPLGFTWVSSAPGMRVVANHYVEPLGPNSRVTLSLEFHGLVGPWFGRLTRGINQRYLELEAKGLAARAVNPLFTHKGRS
jgi:carbon monoxide dehydrogenase subunit G